MLYAGSRGRGRFGRGQQGRGRGRGRINDFEHHDRKFHEVIDILSHSYMIIQEKYGCIL